MTKSAANQAGASTRRITIMDLVTLLVLIIFAGTRSIFVGTDTSIYAVFFTRIDPGDWALSIEASPFEVGYTVLALVVKMFGGNFTTLLLVASTITVGAAFWAIKRIALDVPLAILLYVLLAFYLTPMNLLRQGVAVSLVLLASTFIIARVRLRGLIVFLCLIGVAASFHATAVIVAVVILLLRRVRITFRNALWILTVGAAGVTAIWASGWFSAVIALVNPRYEIYGDIQATGGLGSYLILGFTIVLALWALVLRPAREDAPLATLVLVGCIALLLGTQFIYAVRFADYFTIFLVLLLPNVLKTAEVATGRRVFLVLVSAAYYIAYLSNFGDLVPYRSTISL
ncbi:EpsG family protein [Microbacterium aerolatum]|uniref:EpsG family protein n=1 Tax=Microbacterium aerolatum TaxID=153731 RepID=UPI0016498A37|nr:EpsG family protein [Microbacterium aerolatum]